GPAAELVFPSLLKLVGDPTREVRAAAERAFTRLAGSPQAAVVRRRAADAERALEGALVQGDVAERQTIVAAAVKAELWGLLKQAARDGATSPRVEIVRAAVDDRSEAVRAEAMRLLAGAAGGGARDVLPTFEAMFHGGDRAAREAAVAGVGALADPGEAGFRLLGEAM